MKISLNYIKKYLDFNLPEDVDQVVERIGARLGAVDEATLNLGEVYKSVTIAQVVSAEPIEGSDHLKVCLIDDGQVVDGVERNSNNQVQVVCGAPNVEAGQMVAWLPPGSVVPSTFKNEPFILTARQMLGVTSNGMLASAKELAIGDSHDGILVVDTEANPGDSFSSVYDLNDYIIDIENKMFTHRPDCFGLIGVAREMAGIFNKPFKSPGWYLDQLGISPETAIKPLTVVNELPELVSRFNAVVIDGLEVKPSPISVQSYLSRMGIRPINNIVDATNLVMLETGQPLHAYDYDKLSVGTGAEPSLSIRFPRPDETISLLNGKTLKPRQEAIMIASGDQLIGLAGVMGSSTSEVDSATKTIVLEAASFDMYSIRRSSMDAGVFSDAVTRFSKGQSPLQTKRVLLSCLELIKNLSGPGKALVASEVIDIDNLPESTLKRQSLYPEITVDLEYINSRLGSHLRAEEVSKYLTNVECQVDVTNDRLVIKAPFWRTDLEIREDIVEEVGRLFGYDNLAPKLLTRLASPVTKDPSLELKSRLRSLLVRAGANELLTYSFVSNQLLENAGQDATHAYQIANSLSPELQLYRLSLSPSLLTKVHPNIKAGYDQFALFEIGTYHLLGHNNQAEPSLPEEFQSLALVFASKKPGPGAAYYKAKNYFDYLMSEMNVSGYNYLPLKDYQDKLGPKFEQLARPFNPGRSALVVDLAGNQLGVVGEYRPQTLSGFKLPSYCAGLEIDSQIFMNLDHGDVYSPTSRYPLVKHDVTFKVPAALSYGELYSGLKTKLSDLKFGQITTSLSPLSIFQAKDNQTHKNISFRLVVNDYQKTLSDQVVNKLADELASYCANQFGAERV